MAGLEVVEFRPELAADFYRINAQWIEAMYVMEPGDTDVLSHPQERIINKGGVILFVNAPGLGLVGACALMKTADRCFELTKMGVLESARGKKVGEFLLARMIAHAQTMDMETLYLLTNTKSAAAIHLYEKLGFVHDADIMERFGKRYARCNVAMSYPIGQITGVK